MTTGISLSVDPRVNCNKWRVLKHGQSSVATTLVNIHILHSVKNKSGNALCSGSITMIYVIPYSSENVREIQNEPHFHFRRYIYIYSSERKSLKNKRGYQDPWIGRTDNTMAKWKIQIDKQWFTKHYTEN
jgi:hypothetical protein